MASFLDLYESLDVIGNGSFGIIRKVRRKSDGVVFARKELNFERMSEHDRKQIVAEVNILKDLHHENIVRYHDRYVDREAGILYILMEYCGGGDLSSVIKQSQKQGRPIPEDAIWNYFMQILLALHHCHHPNGHGRSASTGGLNGGPALDGKEKRSQILHRDLKPDNVFLDENNRVKLGDFGLSKALAQASFANTYVGTPYYMSPELMQEKAYDSKSDIWSLGCLIYELCALKPPFHEAKTHSELSIFIRNGRIPPLPRGYSQSLFGVIKAMLNLNPAMRPSAAQLLQHERLELVFKVSEAEKMISTVKTHKNTVATKEREILAREESILKRETQIASLLSQKESEIHSLQLLVSQLQEQLRSQCDAATVEQSIRDAISKREEELRIAVMKREEEVAMAMARREEEIMQAIRLREEEISEAWKAREEQIRDEMVKAMEEQAAWLERRAEALLMQEEALEELRQDLEARGKAMEESTTGRKDRKTPLEEVQNLVARATDQPTHNEKQVPPTPRPIPFPTTLETPITRNVTTLNDYVPSAMKGIILTSTGEALATPTPGELAKLFVASPKVGLNFAKIFDFDDDAEAEHPPASPSLRERSRGDRPVTEDEPTQQEGSASTVPPTRLRRPSTIRRPPAVKSSSSSAVTPASGQTGSSAVPPHPTRNVAPQPPTLNAPVSAPLPPSTKPTPEYDLSDEENLPSPFLKRNERGDVPFPTASRPARRMSNGNLLRAVAVANAATVNAGGTLKRTSSSASATSNQTSGANGVTGNATGARPLIVSARKASEEARKVLLRP